MERLLEDIFDFKKEIMSPRRVKERERQRILSYLRLIKFNKRILESEEITSKPFLTYGE